MLYKVNESFSIFLLFTSIKKKMSFTPATPRNRINPISVSTVEQTTAPYVTYGEVTVCADPNCPVCRAQRRDKRQKPHRRHHHRHRGHKTNFWNSLLPRSKSASSAVSVHSIELDDRRAYYSPHVTEREMVSNTTRSRRIGDEERIRDAWVNNLANILLISFLISRQQIVRVMMKLFVVGPIMVVDVHVGVVLYLLFSLLYS